MKNTRELTNLIIRHPDLSDEEIYNLASSKSKDPEEAQATIWAVHVLKQNREALMFLEGIKEEKNGHK